MIFITIYIYSYLYLWIYTPSYPHFKAFSVSKFNFETSFLYQLFKEDSNFIVIKVIQGYLSAFYDVFVFIFIYTYIYTPSNQHFKAFPVSKINSETSFLYQLFKDNSNFTVLKPWRLFISLFSLFSLLFQIFKTSSR